MFLDYRVQWLSFFSSSFTKWSYCFESMIIFLKSHYHMFTDNYSRGKPIDSASSSYWCDSYVLLRQNSWHDSNFLKIISRVLSQENLNHFCGHVSLMTRYLNHFMKCVVVESIFVCTWHMLSQENLNHFKNVVSRKHNYHNISWNDSNASHKHTNRLF